MDVAQKARAAAEETVTALGFELADTDYAREEGQMCLTFYICREEGVTVDDCETVSRAIEDIVDDADPTGGKPYCLCVSTWGDRALKTERDLERNLGREVEVRLHTPLSGKKKKFVGTLKAFDGESYTIVGKDGELILPRSNVETVRPYIGF